jgi:hypothetical protein
MNSYITTFLEKELLARLEDVITSVLLINLHPNLQDHLLIHLKALQTIVPEESMKQ